MVRSVGYQGLPASSTVDAGRALPDPRGDLTKKDPITVAEPWPIARALKEKCNLPHEAFALILLNNHGQVRTYTTKGLESYASTTFSKKNQSEFFQQAIRQSSTRRHLGAADIFPPNAVTSSIDDEVFENLDSRRSSMTSAVESRKNFKGIPGVPGAGLKIDSRAAKRRKSNSHTYTSVQPPSAGSANEDEEGDTDSKAESEDPPFQRLRIGDKKAVDAFFDTRFQQLQQITCKIVAKAWIKVIEPKKQSHYPYNKGEEKKPPWWPADCTHVEPDHQKKQSRLKLLMTILRLRKVPIEQLEVATNEVLGNIKEEKRHILEEIYKVAKLEERFERSEIDGSVEVPVANSEKALASSRKPRESPKPARLDDSAEEDYTQNSTGGSSGQKNQSLIISPPSQMGGKNDSSDHAPPEPSPVVSDNPFPDMDESSPDRPQTAISAATYPPHYTADHAPQMDDPSSYLTDQPIQVHPNFNFIQREPGFTPSEPGSSFPARPEGPYQPPNPQNIYSDWTTSPMHANFGESLNYAYAPVSASQDTQHSGHSLYQLPAPGPANMGFSSAHSHQHTQVPELEPIRGQQFQGHSQFRTGSLSHPHPPIHGVPGFLPQHRGFGQFDAHHAMKQE